MVEKILIGLLLFAFLLSLYLTQGSKSRTEKLQFEIQILQMWKSHLLEELEKQRRLVSQLQRELGKKSQLLREKEKEKALVLDWDLQ